MKKLSNTEAELSKSIAYKEKCVLATIIPSFESFISSSTC